MSFEKIYFAFCDFFRFSMRYTDHNTHASSRKKNFVDISYIVKLFEVSLALC